MNRARRKNDRCSQLRRPVSLQVCINLHVIVARNGGQRSDKEQQHNSSKLGRLMLRRLPLDRPALKPRKRGGYSVLNIMM